MSFDPSQFIGQFGAFYLRPDSVDRCLPRPSVKRHVGQCIGAKPAPDTNHQLPLTSFAHYGLAVLGLKCQLDENN